MATDGRTLLHVVYAGRGDAFILEYTIGEHRFFVLVDGGPQTGGPPINTAKPYYKYLFHALKDVWSKQDLGDIIHVDAMICSHPHEDHIDGLIQLLETMNDEASLLMFSGPFVLPNVEASMVERLKEVLQKVSFVQMDQGWTCTTVPGIEVDYPDRQNILVYERGKRLPGAIDKSPVNLSSILMSTDPKKTKGAGRVYFTGDNVGHIIERYVGRPASGTSSQNFSIYKIQHHGSKNNSEIHAVSRGVKKEVEREGAVLYILTHYVAVMEGTSSTASLRKFIPPDSLLCLGDYMKTQLGTLADVKKYLGVLVSRQDRYKASIMAQSVPATLSPDHGGPFPADMKITPNKLMLKATSYFNRLSNSDGRFDLFYDVTAPHRRQEPWWVSWQEPEDFCPEFYILLPIPGIRQFYSSFQADCYVISANKTYRHPSAATLIGLGMAVMDQHRMDQRRAARVYLTEGQTVDSSDIVDLCVAATGGITANQLFDQKLLSIWYRSSGYYFTLDGSGSPPASKDREITKRTTQLSFPTDTLTRGSLQNQLEEDTTVLPLRTTISNASEVRYTVYCPVGATNWYLDLLSGQPQVSSTVNAVTYVYDSTDRWPDPAPGANTSTVYIVQTTTGPSAASFPWKFQVGSRSGRLQDNNLAWQLIWERPVTGGSGSEKAAFYVDKTTNAIVSRTYQDPPPMGFDAIRFHFTIVSPVGVSPKLRMQPHGAALPTLKDYYTAIGLLMPPTISCGDALRALLGASILGQLDLSLNFEIAVLGWSVDPQKSSVDFDDEKISTTVHAVSLSFSLPPGTTIPFDNVHLKVLSVMLTIDWPDDTTNPGTPLKLDLVVDAERSVRLSCNPRLNNVDRVTTMRECLLGMGVTADELSTLRVPKLLGFLINNPNTVVEALLNAIPSFLVNAGLPLLKMDLDNSTVDAFWDPLGKIIIRRADIICQVAGVSGWASQSIAGIALTMGDITITATDILTPNQQLSFTGSASFTHVADTEGITLGFSCVLGSDASDLVFSISGTEAVSALPTLLPGVPNLTQLKTPFSASSLGQMTSSMIGFSIKQPVNSIPTYDLASLFVVVNLDDWKAFLPSSFPIGGIDNDSVIIRVLVMEPRNADTRLVAVNIDCSIHLSSPLPPVLNVNFAADPLIAAGSYEFRLTVGAPPIRDLGATTGLTLANVCQAIGMADVSSGIASSIPVLGQVLTAIQVVELSVAILQQKAASTTTYTFGDWRLRLYVNSFVIVPKVLAITQASMDMHNINGLFSCEVNGSIVLTSANATTDVDVVLKPPTQGATGQIRIDAPGGLSIADIMDAFGLPDLTSVPVVGTIISVAVNSVHCTLGYPANSTDIACLGATLELRLDSLDLGILNLAALTLSIEYHEPNDPLGPGYEQKAFSVSALLADGTLAATVSYDSHAGTLSATLVQVQTVSVTQLLQKILPSMVANVLSGLIGNMNFDHVDLVLDTANENIKSFSVALTSNETLAVGSLTLTSLSIVYAAATAGPPATPATLVVRGVVQKDTVGAVISISCTSNDAVSPSVHSAVNVGFSVTRLTPTSLPLSGFIGLLGIPPPSYTPPAGCPTFDGLQVTDISGEISVTTVPTSSTATGTSLEIVSLSASVVTLPGIGIDILPALGIQLTQMRLNISYAKKVTSGSISGYLPINKIGGVWVLFAIQGGQELYAADLNLGSQQQMDATDIYHTFLNPDDEWAIPADLNIPSALPLADIHSMVIRGVSIDIWGFGRTGPAGWEIAASGVKLTTASLGGRIRILEPPKPTTSAHVSSTAPAPAPKQRQYDVYIIGRASFTGFSGANAAEARLNIKPDNGVTKTARVTKTATGSELNTLSQELDDSPGSKWSSIIPKTTTSISLDQDGIYVYADLTKGKTTFALYGSVTGIGSLLLLGRPNLTPASPGRSYFVSLVIQDLGALWPSFSNIMGLFDFGMLTAEIMAYDGTVNDIYTDLKTLPIDFATSDVVVPDASTVIAPMLAEYGTTKLGRAALFSGTLKLKTESPKSMTGGFAMASDPSSTGTVTLWAHVPDNPSTAVFGMIMKDVALLGGAIVINGFGQYTEKLLTISAASLALKIPGMADTLDFQVELTVTPEETNFNVATSKLTLPSPFGDMFSVTFETLGIAGKIAHSGPTYTLSTTSVLLGGHPTGLGGSIIFPGGKPQIAVLDAMNMNILDIFTKIIQYDPATGSTPGSWPALYNPFTVKNAVVYYNSGAPYKISDDMTYQQYYNVHAELSMFGVDFSLNINIPSRAGIKVTGTYIGTIDLKFVQLGPYPPSSPTTKGPTLTIETTAKATLYQYESAVSFFGLEGLGITLQYTKDGQEDLYSGDLKYDRTILGVANPSISVSYNSTTDQWSFGPWDIIQDISNAVDIIKEIIKQSETQSCGSLVGLALDNVTIKVSPKLTLTSGTDTSRTALAGTPYLKISFDVTFSLTVAKKEIFSIPLPNDHLIPPQKMRVADFNTTSLESFVLSVFVQFAKNLAFAVLENPSALGALIAQMVISEFGEELVTNLLCRGCDNPDLETTAKNWADKNHSDGEDSGGQSQDKFDGVASAEAIDAAADLFAAGSALLATTLGILGTLAALIDKIAKIFGIDAGLEQKLSDLQNKVDKLQAEKSAANALLNKALDMGGIPDLKWASVTRLEDAAPQTSVAIDWSKAVPNSKAASWYKGFNGFQWIVSANTTGGISDPGVTYTETDSTKRATTLQDAEFAYSSTVYVWVTARYVTARYGDFHSDATPPAATITHIPYLRPPTLTLTSTATGLTVQFSGQVNPPAQESYMLQIAGTDVASRSLILFEQTLPKSPSDGVNIRWDQLTPTSPMPASITAYIQAVSSDPSKAHDSIFVASSTSFNLLAPPTGLTVKPDENDTNITVSWNQPGAMPTAPDYDLEVRDRNNVLIEPVTITPGTSPDGKRSAQISSIKFTAGESIAVAVRAHVPSTAPQGTISIFTLPVTSVIQPSAIPVIDSSNTYWDIPSKTLHLVVGFAADILSSSTFQVRPDDLTRPPLTVSSSTITKRSASLVVTEVPSNPWPKAILVAATVSAGETGPYSAPWTFPAAAAGGIAAPYPAVQFSSIGPPTMTVYWDLVPNAQWTTLSLIYQAPGPIWPPHIVTQRVDSPKSAYTFALKALFDESKGAQTGSSGSMTVAEAAPWGWRFSLSMESCANGIRGGGVMLWRPGP